MAPVRWRGNLSENAGWGWSDIGTSRFRNTHGLNLSADSFIRAPWYALIGGHMNLTFTQEESKNSAGETTGASDGTGVSGGVDFNLFPRSRFPFSAALEVSDSRASSEFMETDYISTRISLRQSYRPPKGTDHYHFSYDRSMLEGDEKSDTVDALNASYSRTTGVHNWNADSRLAWSNRDGDSASSNRFFTANLRHGWRPEEATYQVETLANVNDTLTSGAGDLHSLFMQLSSTASWRPDTEKPLQVTGAARLFGVDNNLGDDAGMATLLSANASLTYALRPRVNVGAGANLSHNSFDGGSATSASLSSNIAYSPESLKFGAFTYSWGTGANAGTQWSSAGSSTQSIGASVNHSLSRDWAISPTSSINLNLSQAGSGSTAFGGVIESSVFTRTLSNNATTGLRFSPLDSTAMSLSVGVADSYSWSDTTSRFQMVNAQLNGQINFSRNASFSANLSMQASRQYGMVEKIDEFGVTTEVEEVTDSSSIYGSLNFSHNRLFGINNLRYSLQFNANTLGLDNRRDLGNVDATPEQIDMSLEQRLTYRIGRLSTSLTHRMAETEGRTNSSVNLTLMRSFGDR